jgi:acetyltransferase-like isoleucine patch superfamily enzyme
MSVKRKINKFFIMLLSPFSIIKKIKETKDTQTPITFKMWFFQKVLGFNRQVYWPTHFTSVIAHPRNIYAGIDTSPGYSHGCYIQGVGKIYIGDYTQIAPNVGIISANHNLYDSREHQKGKIYIGKYCWIGMNSMILPNVNLGDFTIVGAGSIVTKSFPDGYCVIGGNPAKVIKFLDKNKCKPFRNHYEYNGYYKHDFFCKNKDIFINKELFNDYDY